MQFFRYSINYLILNCYLCTAIQGLRCKEGKVAYI